jgi:chromatin remodeling complex protein RSC6
MEEQQPAAVLEEQQPAAVLEEQQPAEAQEPQQQPRRRGPRGKYARRWYYQKNHFIKSADGTRSLTGYRKHLKKIPWTRNRGRRNLRRKVRLDQHLAAIVGRTRATRAKITKRIWEYVKRNNLQNPENGRFFKPDKLLATVVGSEGEYINGFTIMKLIKNHIGPI